MFCPISTALGDCLVYAFLVIQETVQCVCFSQVIRIDHSYLLLNLVARIYLFIFIPALEFARCPYRSLESKLCIDVDVDN